MRDVLDAFAGHAARRPAALAAFDPERALSYAELAAATDRAAHAIVREGARPGAVLGYYGGVGLERLIAMIAAQKAGLCFVPLDRADPKAVHEVILANARPDIVVAAPEHVDAARELHGAAAALPSGPVRPGDVPPFAPADVGGDALSLIKYTSGTTGRPKGVPSSRDAEAHFGRTAARMAALGPEDRISHFGTYRTWAVYAALLQGAAIGYFDVRTRGTDALMVWLDAERISALFCFPAIFRQMAATQRRLPRLRHLQLVGEALAADDLAAFERICAPGAVLMNKYGSSEHPWIAAYTHRRGDPAPPGGIPIGRPIEPDALSLLGPDGDPVAPGETGEIVLDSPTAPTGYHADPERSAAVFRPGPSGRPRYHTGDLARKGDDGQLYAMGRADDQIKIRGYTLRPGMIELELLRHPEVAEAAVVAVAYPDGVRRLVCHYVGDAAPRSLRAHLAERLPAYMVPALFLAHDSLPKTRTGKVRRQDLPHPFTTPATPAR